MLFYKRRSDHPLGGKTYKRIEATRRRAASIEGENEQAQLPTPPNEYATIHKVVQSQPPPFAVSSTGKNIYRDSWRSGSPAAEVNLSPSPPALGENDSQSISEDEAENSLMGQPKDNELLGDGQETLTGRSFEFPNPSSIINSPASSNVADLGDDMDELDDPFTPQENDADYPSEEREMASPSPTAHMTTES